MRIFTIVIINCIAFSGNYWVLLHLSEIITVAGVIASQKIYYTCWPDTRPSRSSCRNGSINMHGM